MILGSELLQKPVIIKDAKMVALVRALTNRDKVRHIVVFIKNPEKAEKVIEEVTFRILYPEEKPEVIEVVKVWKLE